MRLTGFLVVLFMASSALCDDTPTHLVIKPEAFPTLVNPNCSHCRDEAKRRAGELRADDRVLCWTRGYSDGGAIPYRFFLNAYPVISDSYGVFVHDQDAGFVRGYEPSYNFRFHGWRNGVMVMKHKDGTLYSTLSGIAIAGPKKGARLKAIPTLVSDWGTWLEQYPHAVAYHMFDKYKAVDLAAAPNSDALKSRPRSDSRLPAESLVLGVTSGKDSTAFPLAMLEKSGFSTEKLGNKEFVVLWYGPTRTAAAYLPEASPPRKYPGPQPNDDGVSPAQPEPVPVTRSVTLRRDDKLASAPFTDKETSSHWDIAGRAVDGELKGWTLTWLDSIQVKWFAWAAEYPDSSIQQK